MRRTTIPLAAGITAVLIAAATSASATTSGVPPLETATVTVSGMTLIPDGAEGVAPATSSETFEVTAPAAELDTLVRKQLAEASKRVAAIPKVQKGGLTVQKSETLVGSCGTSYVILRSTTSQTQGQGYVEAGFDLSSGVVSNATAYNTDTLIYSNASTDLWTAHLKDSGADLVGRSWSKGSRVDIPKTQDYGAHFYVGTVQVTFVNGQSGSCSTSGPRVDNVMLYKS